MNQRMTTHYDYAEEAESAQRAKAWPQAAALWDRAIEQTRVLDRDLLKVDSEGVAYRRKYENQKQKCEEKMAIDRHLESIARRALDQSAELDFHFDTS